MSDFDINCAVAESEGICWYSTPSNSPSGGWEYCNVDHLMINQDSELLDYCNDASAAWPIIVKSRIAINPVHRVRNYNERYDSWDVSCSSPRFCEESDRPLRAAMIVHLLKRNEK
ncbi:MAG: phage protein NinX family protein [Plesiomonas shigelloides]